MANSKERMIADTMEKAKIRQEMYQKVIARYNDAMEKGCFLEAIALMESIITDRLESAIGYEEPDNKADFTMLGRALSRIRNYPEIVPEELNQKLSEWKDGRNSALHEMAKIEDDNPESFEDKYNKAKKIAEDGKVLFRAVDSAVRKNRL